MVSPSRISHRVRIQGVAPRCHRLCSLAAVVVTALMTTVIGCVSPASAAVPQAGPGQWYIPQYGIDEMWETTTGKGVTVAVIDSGVDDKHENLHGVVSKAKDFSGTHSDGTTPVGTADTIHHGTAVAGVIAGTGTGQGPTGVAPDAKILSASMWLGSGQPEAADPSRVQAEKAIRWAIDSGADVINMSLGWDDPSWPQSWDDAFDYAYEHDVVIVACVGNRSQGAKQAWSPATVPGVVGVGGLNRNGHVLPGSTAPGIAVDLMAPAVDIPVPYYSGGYAQAQGCSFASPILAGVIALIRSAHPELSADQVVAKLTSTADPVPGHDGRNDGDTQDPVVGYGKVSPVEALNSPVPQHYDKAEHELAEWIYMHRRAEKTPSARTSPHSALSLEARPDREQDVRASSTPLVGLSVVLGGFGVSMLLVGIVIYQGICQRRQRQEQTDTEVETEPESS